MTASPKEPFDIDVALQRIAALQSRYPVAALWRLAEEGYASLFEVLIGCILSVRTLDEVMAPAARRLLAQARTPEEMMQLTPERLTELITPCSFADRKAQQILEIARRLVAEYQGVLPCDRETLLAFKGVGPKCANLSLAIACEQPYISVDVHVHRVVNRWGYVQTTNPEATLKALEAKLPLAHWRELNRWLMPFGKFICMEERPRCSLCPVLDMCPQIDVLSHR